MAPHHPPLEVSFVLGISYSVAELCGVLTKVKLLTDYPQVPSSKKSLWDSKCRRWCGVAAFRVNGKLTTRDSVQSQRLSFIQTNHRQPSGYYTIQLKCTQQYELTLLFVCLEQFGNSLAEIMTLTLPLNIMWVTEKFPVSTDLSFNVQVELLNGS